MSKYNKIITSLLLIISIASVSCQAKSEELKEKKNMHKKIANRLINEKSPYLLQHAYNPVDWYPWGDEAFKKAKKKNKPVFLSIGYSTCHWCHVMERESFEDIEIAKLLNDTFINIKVDREERPDIDKIYMAVCTALTGSGGWPLTIIMTPDKKPFFAGTYFPKEHYYRRPGMMDIIPQIDKLWKTKRNDLVASADHITSTIFRIPDKKTGDTLDLEILKKAFALFLSSFDDAHGGFNDHPKFPSPHNLTFLLRYYKRSGDKRALNMVEKTLDFMRKGGIYDHIAYGFHRYSTDNKWLTPHFEKMLYDQAMLAIAYTEAFQLTGKSMYKKTAEEIFTYVLRDMTSGEGAFFSAEDADIEGVEGKFYIWKDKEIRQILNEKEADLITEFFNVKKEGNFKDEATGKKTGTNILHITSSPEIIAEKMKIPEHEFYRILESGRKKLFSYREKRIKPFKDDKILTDWNGLMIVALSKAARVFDNDKYYKAAEKSADFILNNMKKKDGNLLHRFRHGESGLPSHLDDYAFFCWGLLELYESGFDTKYLKEAIDINSTMIKNFYDDKSGAFFFTSENNELLFRKKEIYDGAIPSGNSIAMLNLVRISKITADTEYEKKAIQTARYFFEDISQIPIAHSQALSAIDYIIGPSHEIFITASKNARDTEIILKSLRKQFIPNKIVILKDTEEENSQIERIAPYLKVYKKIEGKATVYVCRDFNCRIPTTDKDIMLRNLGINDK
jgi:uncharacterized protein